MAGSTQDVYVVASLSTLSILIVASNVFVCSLVCFNKAPRSHTNWLIVSLAVSDILTGGVLLPVLLIKPSSIIPNYLACMILLSGVANLCSVTYDRYVAIIKPLEYQYRAPKILKRSVILSWLIPAIYSLIPLTWDTDPTLKIHKAYIICLQFFGIIVPYVCITFAYVQIFRQVRRSSAMKRNFECPPVHKNERKRLSSDAKVAKVFCIVSAAFTLCWLPIIYITTANTVLNRFDIIPDVLPTVSFFTIATGSLVNPLIYAFLKPDFKMAIRNFLPRRTRSDTHESSNGFLAIVKWGKEKSEVSLPETLAKTKDSSCFSVNIEAISYRLKEASESRLSVI